MLAESGQHVPVRDLHLNDYQYEEVWLTVDKIASPSHPHLEYNCCPLVMAYVVV